MRAWGLGVNGVWCMALEDCGVGALSQVLIGSRGTWKNPLQWQARLKMPGELNWPGTLIDTRCTIPHQSNGISRLALALARRTGDPTSRVVSVAFLRLPGLVVTWRSAS